MPARTESKSTEIDDPPLLSLPAEAGQECRSFQLLFLQPSKKEPFGFVAEDRLRPVSGLSRETDVTFPRF